jgi:lysophospholipase L1-like esterase
MRSAIGLLFLALTVPGFAHAEHWVATWATAPEDAGSLHNDLRFDSRPFATPLGDQTVRMRMRATLDGARVRVRFTNAFGTDDLLIGAASISTESGRPGASTQLKALTFRGNRAMAISPSGEATTDAVTMSVAAGQKLIVSLYLPRATKITTSHSMDALADPMYVARGNVTDHPTSSAFKYAAAAWVFTASIEVATRDEASAIVLLGDSITDGVGADVAAYERWSDLLADRLARSGRTASVLNLGITGNRLLHPEAPGPGREANYIFGPSALSRIRCDVLRQPGVRYLVVLIGINDLGIPHPKVSADEIVQGLKSIIEVAHVAGVRVYGSTLTPALGTRAFETLGGFGAAEETMRSSVNAAIRSGSVFDAVIDFDAVVRDPGNPAIWRNDLSDDHLHPNRLGARRMAEAIPLALFDRGG